MWARLGTNWGRKNKVGEAAAVTYGRIRCVRSHSGRAAPGAQGHGALRPGGGVMPLVRERQKAGGSGGGAGRARGAAGGAVGCGGAQAPEGPPRVRAKRATLGVVRPAPRSRPEPGRAHSPASQLGRLFRVRRRADARPAWRRGTRGGGGAAVGAESRGSGWSQEWTGRSGRGGTRRGRGGAEGGRGARSPGAGPSRASVPGGKGRCAVLRGIVWLTLLI